jgi:hypothetical protein
MAGSRFIQSHDEVQKGCLATAVGSNQSYPLTPVKFEIKMVQHGLAAGVAEIDVH